MEYQASEQKKIMEMEFIYEITQKDKKLEKLQQQVIRNKYRLTLIAIGSITALCILYGLSEEKSSQAEKTLTRLTTYCCKRKKS